MLLASLAMCYACETHTVYHSYHSFPASEWKKNDTLFFCVPVKDSLSFHNIFIEVRNNDFYPYQDLYLAICQNGPDSVLHTDTLRCVLASPEGTWKGNGLGSLYQSEHFYASRNFGTTGTYRFKISQMMSNSSLKGISDLGIKIILP